MKQTTQQRRSRGTALVLVLGLTTLLVTLGIAATQIARGELKRNDLEHEQADARIAAQYTLDYIQKALDGNTSWRADATNETWSLFSHMDGVTTFYAYLDPIDGDVTNDASQPFLLYSLAVSGNSKRAYRVELTPDSEGNLKRNDATFEQVIFE